MRKSEKRSGNVRAEKRKRERNRGSERERGRRREGARRVPGKPMILKEGREDEH